MRKNFQGEPDFLSFSDSSSLWCNLRMTLGGFRARLPVWSVTQPTFRRRLGSRDVKSSTAWRGGRFKYDFWQFHPTPACFFGSRVNHSRGSFPTLKIPDILQPQLTPILWSAWHIQTKTQLEKYINKNVKLLGLRRDGTKNALSVRSLCRPIPNPQWRAHARSHTDTSQLEATCHCKPLQRCNFLPLLFFFFYTLGVSVTALK